MSTRPKPSAKSPPRIPRDPATGKLVPAGYGSLKGKATLQLDPGIDLTRPIFEQAAGKHGASAAVPGSRISSRPKDGKAG